MIRTIRGPVGPTGGKCQALVQAQDLLRILFAQINLPGIAHFHILRRSSGGSVGNNVNFGSICGGVLPSRVESVEVESIAISRWWT